MNNCKPCGIPSTVLEVDTTYHSNLLGLDDENQHPIKSIIGLEEHLTLLDTDTEELNEKIDSNTTTLDNKIDSSVEILNEKIDLKQNKLTLTVENKTLVLNLNN